MMTPLEKLIGVGLAVALLLVLGGGGAWFASRHYRSLLDVANSNLASATAARDNLVTLAGEQGRKRGELVKAGELRERNATLAQEKVSQEAQPDFAVANQLLRERTGATPHKRPVTSLIGS